MKKLFSVLLAVAMLCTMSVSAFVATVTTTGDTSASLTVKYSEGTGKKDNYAATITWGSMEFTYTSAGQKWNTEKMIWEDNEDGTWSKGSEENAGTVTISNKSSQPIDVKFSYVSEATTNGVTGISVTPNNPTLAEENSDIYAISAASPGANGANGTATIEVFNILPTGTYTGTNTDAVKVGTITITLS